MLTLCLFCCRGETRSRKDDAGEGMEITVDQGGRKVAREVDLGTFKTVDAVRSNTWAMGMVIY